MKRKYRRYILGEDSVIACLCGRARVVLPEGACVIGVQTDFTAYPPTFHLIVYSDEFPEVELNMQVPLAEEGLMMETIER